MSSGLPEGADVLYERDVEGNDWCAGPNDDIEVDEEEVEEEEADEVSGSAL